MTSSSQQNVLIKHDLSKIVKKLFFIHFHNKRNKLDHSYEEKKTNNIIAFKFKG